MKILVAVKKVIDYNVKIRVKPDGSGVETDHVKMSMNPFDEIAVEEAIRLKEKSIATEVIVTSIGSDSSQTLRSALAMGADRAIMVKTNRSLEPLHVAKILKRIVEKEQATLAILGKQAIDDDCNQTGQMLAALLKWSQGTFVSKLKIKEGAALVTREIDGGLEVLSIKLPAVVTTDLRLNEPRYISLPNIMKAKTKPLEILPLAELNVELKEHVTTLNVAVPSERNAGKKVNSINELLKLLKEKDKVLV